MPAILLLVHEWHVHAVVFLSQPPVGGLHVVGGSTDRIDAT